MTTARRNPPAVQEIQFHGDTLLTIKTGDQIRVAIKPIAERLGLDWRGHLKTVKRDPVLAEGVVVMTTPSAGGPQETVTLPLEYLNGWLFKIDAARYKSDDSRREVIIRYQKECFIALYDYWHRGAAEDPRVAASFPQDSGGLKEDLWNLSMRVACLEAQVRGALPPALPAARGNLRTPFLHLPAGNPDPETSRLRALLAVWAECFGPAGRTVSKAIREAESDSRGRLWTALNEIAGERGTINHRRLGRWMARHARCVLEGSRLIRVGTLHKGVVWSVERIPQHEPGSLQSGSTPVGPSLVHVSADRGRC